MCPPASMPCTTTTSQPASAAALASSSEPTCQHASAPPRWASSTSAGSGSAQKKSTIWARAVAAAAARAQIVDFFWADPDPALVELAHRGGALACWQVGSLDEAKAAADAGCDVVVVQGIEAGGHIRGYS